MSSINAYVSSGAVSKENETCQSKILLKPLSVRNTQDAGWGGGGVGVGASKTRNFLNHGLISLTLLVYLDHYKNKK